MCSQSIAVSALSPDSYSSAVVFAGFLMNCAAGALTTECCLGGGITAGHLCCAYNDRA